LDLELPEYLLLGAAVVLGVLVRHWWQRRKSSAARNGLGDKNRQ
jgi:hypothetical protein